VWDVNLCITAAMTTAAIHKRFKRSYSRLGQVCYGYPIYIYIYTRAMLRPLQGTATCSLLLRTAPIRTRLQHWSCTAREHVTRPQAVKHSCSFAHRRLASLLFLLCRCHRNNIILRIQYVHVCIVVTYIAAKQRTV